MPCVNVNNHSISRRKYE